MLLPAPERPRITSTSARRTSRSRPSRTTFSPKDLRTSRRMIGDRRGTSVPWEVAVGASDAIEEPGHVVPEHEDEHDRGDDGAPHSRADAERAALRAESVRATDEPDHDPEHERLHQPGVDVRRQVPEHPLAPEGAARPVEVGPPGDAELGVRHER